MHDQVVVANAQDDPLSIDENGMKMRGAVGQFKFQPDLKTNLQKINSLLDEAANLEVDMVVFPELALTGYTSIYYKSIDYIDKELTEKALEHLQAKARELSMAIAIGAGWKDASGVWRNRAWFINNQGILVAYYDKIQQTEHERHFFVDGDKLPVFEWNGIRLGMLICMDMHYPELGRIMRKRNAAKMLVRNQ